MAIVNLYCTSCEAQIGIFENEWIRLTTSYAWPKQKGTHFGTEIGNKTQIVPPGGVRDAAEGCEMADVFCCSCHATVGRYCKTAPSKEQQYLADNYFYKFSRVHFKNAQTFHLVDPVFGFGGEETKAAPTSSRRGPQASSSNLRHDAREIREKSWSPDDSQFQRKNYQPIEDQLRKRDRHSHNGFEDLADNDPPFQEERYASARPNRHSSARKSGPFLDGSNSRRATSQLSVERPIATQAMPAPSNRNNRNSKFGNGAAPSRLSSTAQRSELVHDRYSSAPMHKAARKTPVGRLSASNLQRLEHEKADSQSSSESEDIDEVRERLQRNTNTGLHFIDRTLELSDHYHNLHQSVSDRFMKQYDQIARLDMRQCKINTKLDDILNKLQEIEKLLDDRELRRPRIEMTQSVMDHNMTTTDNAFLDAGEMQRPGEEIRVENESTNHQTDGVAVDMQSPGQESGIDQVKQKKRPSRTSATKRKRQASYGPRKRSSLRTRASKANEVNETEDSADLHGQEASAEPEEIGQGEIEDHDVERSGPIEDFDTTTSAQATMATVLNGVVKSRGSKTALPKGRMSEDNSYLGTQGDLMEEDSLFLQNESELAAGERLYADEDIANSESASSSEQVATKTDDFLTPEQAMLNPHHHQIEAHIEGEAALGDATFHDSLGEAIDFSDDEPIVNVTSAIPELDTTTIQEISPQAAIESLVDTEAVTATHSTRDADELSITSSTMLSVSSKGQPKGNRQSSRRRTLGVDAVNGAAGKASKASRRKTMPEEPPRPKKEKFSFQNFTPESIEDALRTGGRPEALTRVQEDELAQSARIAFETTIQPTPPLPPAIQKMIVQGQGYNGNQFGRTLLPRPGSGQVTPTATEVSGQGEPIVAHDLEIPSVIDPQLENWGADIAAGTNETDSLPTSSFESLASGKEKASAQPTKSGRRLALGKPPLKATKKRKSEPVSTPEQSSKRQATRSSSSVDPADIEQPLVVADPSHDQALEESENAASRVTRSSSRKVNSTTNVSLSAAIAAKETAKKGKGIQQPSSNKQTPSKDEIVIEKKTIEAAESDKENEIPESVPSTETGTPDAKKDQEDKIRERDRLVEEAMRMEMMAMEA